jgi:hypothetical protein
MEKQSRQFRVDCCFVSFLLFVLANSSFADGLSKLEPLGPQPTLRTPQGGKKTIYEKSYALVITVSDYGNGWSPIPNADSEGDQISKVLRENGFSVWRVREPTRNDLDRILTEFVATNGHKIRSRVIIYFAGHGYTRPTDKAGYIVLRNASAPNNDASNFFKGAFPIRNFENIAAEIEAVHALFIFDSCFSGSIFGVRSDSPESAPPKGNGARLRLLTSEPDPVRQIITAGRANEEVPQSGHFTPYLVHALRSGIASTDGFLTGKELGTWLMAAIPEATRNRQHPLSDVVRSTTMIFGDMVFAPPKAVSADTPEKTGVPAPAQPDCFKFNDKIFCE